MFTKLINFYNREDINTGRQKNIDYAKGIAIIGMILVHIMIYPSYGNFEHGVGFAICYIFGGFLAAPVFMTSMGVGLAYSNHNEPKKIILRGAKLVALNYILNLLRSVYPLVKTFVIGENLFESICYHLFNGDILLFAGLAMIVFGLFKCIKNHSNLWMLIAAVVMLAISSIFKVVNNENTILAYTLGMIIPVNYFEEPIICFQLFSWFIYVVVGYLLAVTIRKVKNLNLFYLILGIIGIALSTTMLLLDYYLGLEQFFITNLSTDPEYLAGYGYQLIGIGAVFFQYSLFHFICKITPNKLNNVVFRFSSMLNEIYMISWIIILNITYPILKYTIGDNSPLLWPFLVSFAIVFPISAILGDLWRKYKKKKVAKKLSAQTNE